MAKTKNKKSKSSDDVHNKKRNASKTKLNPFEVHINKEKMIVLGKKSKNDRGLPGISRSKGIQKRKATLLQEYKLQNKSNLFRDRRLGERTSEMTEEDRATARFAAVRVKAHKKSIFNLADDEVLTHKGKIISEIDKFDDPRSDDEDSLDGSKGKLESGFVENAHFAGGIFRNTNKEGAKTHKELIDELIAESKKRKAEKQKAKEATLELTEKLDAEWRDLMPLMAQGKVNSKDDTEDRPKLDDYDKLAKQLKFEAKGKVSDRLKTEDELAKEEKEKLEELEKERLDRMRGIVNNQVSKPVHRSADDLDDNFVYDSDIDEEQMLTYNEEGEANVEIDAQFKGKNISNKKKSDNIEDVSVESGGEEEVDNDLTGEEETSDELTGEEEESGGELASEEEESDDDDLADLKNEDSSSEEEDDSDEGDGSSNLKVGRHKKEEENEDVNKIKLSLESKAGKRITDNDTVCQSTSKKRKFSEGETVSISNGTKDASELQQKIKEDLLKRKEIMEKARKELPYTFNIPESYDDLLKAFENYSPNHQSIIVERMIKCNHPSLAEANKEKLALLFKYLMQYLNDIASNANDETSVKNCFEILAVLVPHIYDLAQFDKDSAHKTMLEVIKEKHELYRKKSKAYPGLENLVFLKLVSILFSTSDFRHQVVTPCFVFMDQMLTKCKVKTKMNIAYGLFLSTLVLEYTFLSKRYLPSVINYLGGLLHMSIPKFSVKIIKVLPPFKVTSNELVLSDDETTEDFNPKMTASDLVNDQINADFKIRTMYTVVKLLQEFNDNFKTLSSNVEIFKPILYYLESIPQERYPGVVQKEIEDLMAALKRNVSERKLQYVVMPAKRPKALRLYEPKIEDVYDVKRHKVQSKEKANQAKLIYKLKQEKKGALREMRRDQSFLSRVKIKQNIESDKERREKVKKIFSEAAMQQSELKALDRSKKRKK